MITDMRLIKKSANWFKLLRPRYYTINRAMYQLRRTNVTPAADRLAALEAWVPRFEDVEARLAALESKGAGDDA